MTVIDQQLLILTGSLWISCLVRIHRSRISSAGISCRQEAACSAAALTLISRVRADILMRRRNIFNCSRGPPLRCTYIPSSSSSSVRISSLKFPGSLSVDVTYSLLSTSLLHSFCDFFSFISSPLLVSHFFSIFSSSLLPSLSPLHYFSRPCSFSSSLSVFFPPPLVSSFSSYYL